MNNLEEHFINTPVYSQEELSKFRREWLNKYDKADSGERTTVSEEPAAANNVGNIPNPLDFKSFVDQTNISPPPVPVFDWMAILSMFAKPMDDMQQQKEDVKMDVPPPQEPQSQPQPSLTQAPAIEALLPSPLSRMPALTADIPTRMPPALSVSSAFFAKPQAAPILPIVSKYMIEPIAAKPKQFALTLPAAAAAVSGAAAVTMYNRNVLKQRSSMYLMATAITAGVSALETAAKRFNYFYNVNRLAVEGRVEEAKEIFDARPKELRGILSAQDGIERFSQEYNEIAGNIQAVNVMFSEFSSKNLNYKQYVTRGTDTNVRYLVKNQYTLYKIDDAQFYAQEMDRDLPMADDNLLESEMQKALDQNDQEAIKNLAMAYQKPTIDPGFTAPEPSFFKQSVLTTGKPELGETKLGGSVDGAEVELADKIQNLIDNLPREGESQQQQVAQQQQIASDSPQSRLVAFTQSILGQVHSQLSNEAQHAISGLPTTQQYTESSLDLNFADELQQLAAKPVTTNTVLEMAALMQSYEDLVNDAGKDLEQSILSSSVATNAKKLSQLVEKANAIAKYLSEDAQPNVKSISPQINSARNPAFKYLRPFVQEKFSSQNERVAKILGNTFIINNPTNKVSPVQPVQKIDLNPKISTPTTSHIGLVVIDDKSLPQTTTASATSSAPEIISNPQLLETISLTPISAPANQEMMPIEIPSSVDPNIIANVIEASDVDPVEQSRQLAAKIIEGVKTYVPFGEMSMNLASSGLTTLVDAVGRAMSSLGNNVDLNLNSLVERFGKMVSLANISETSGILSEIQNIDYQKTMINTIDNVSSQLAIAYNSLHFDTLNNYLANVTLIPTLVRNKAKKLNYQTSIMCAAWAASSFTSLSSPPPTIGEMKSKISNIMQDVVMLRNKKWSIDDFINHFSKAKVRMSLQQLQDIVSKLELALELNEKAATDMVLFELQKSIDPEMLIEELSQLSLGDVASKIGIDVEQTRLAAKEAFSSVKTSFSSFARGDLKIQLGAALFGFGAYYSLFTTVYGLAIDFYNYSGLNLVLPFMDTLLSSDPNTMSSFEIVLVSLLDYIDLIKNSNKENLSAPLISTIYGSTSASPYETRLEMTNLVDGQYQSNDMSYFDVRRNSNIKIENAFDSITNYKGESNWDEVEGRYTQRSYDAYISNSKNMIKVPVHVPNRDQMLKWSQSPESQGRIFFLFNSLISTNPSHGIIEQLNQELANVLDDINTRVKSAPQMQNELVLIGKILGSFVYIQKRMQMIDAGQTESFVYNLNMLHSQFSQAASSIMGKFVHSAVDPQTFKGGVRCFPNAKGEMTSKLCRIMDDMPVAKPLTAMHLVSDNLYKMAPPPKEKIGTGLKYDSSVKGCGVCGGYSKLLAHEKDHDDLTCDKCYHGRGMMTSKSYTSRTTKLLPAEQIKAQAANIRKIKNNEAVRLIKSSTSSAAQENPHDMFYGKGKERANKILNWLNSTYVPFKKFNPHVHSDYLSTLIGQNELQPEGLRKAGRVNLTNLITKYLASHQQPTANYMGMGSFEELKREIAMGNANLKSYQI